MEDLRSFHGRRFKPKETTMKIDQNKKIMMGVALILYILYKMMGG